MSWWIVLLFDATEKYRYSGYEIVLGETLVLAQIQAVAISSEFTSHRIVAGVTFGPFDSQPEAFL